MARVHDVETAVGKDDLLTRAALRRGLQSGVPVLVVGGPLLGIAQDLRGGGKMLIDCPGYQYQALLTNLPPSTAALDVWRDYNGRAAMENVIKELKNGFGLPGFCCHKFFATEAVLSLAVFTYNLYQLFCRHVGLLGPATIATARYRLFHCAGILSRRAKQVTLALAIPPPKRPWWTNLWRRLTHPKSQLQCS